MRIHTRTWLAAATLAAAGLTGGPAAAQESDGLEALKQEIRQMRQAYEARITQLEARISDLEAAEREAAAAPAPMQQAQVQPAPMQQAQAEPAPMPPAPAPTGAMSGGSTSGNAFNPSIGVLLNGRFAAFSKDPANYQLPGFALAGEAGPGAEGFSLDETEINFNSNVNDLFYASTTASLDAGDDGVDVDLEEAYFQTLSLPYGMTIKGGRFFAAIGYLNENHTHTDNFADRPLAYKAFLNGQYNDDGVQLAVVLPTELYVQVGGGAFRGADFPAGGAAHDGVGAYTGFLRLGGDIGFESTWRAGLSYLHADARGRATGPEDADPADLLTFDGKSNLYIADFKFQWSPNGNIIEKYIELQGEYLFRDQNGTYNNIAYDGQDSGWYLEGVYKFNRNWRAAYRYERLNPENNLALGLLGTDLNSFGHSPRAQSFGIDWARNEFSLVRLQFTHDMSRNVPDNRFYIQYIMSIGAHTAHNF